MKDWTQAGRVFYWAQITVAVLLLGFALARFPLSLSPSQAWFGPAAFLAGNLTANLFPIRLRDFEFTVSGIVVIAAIIVFPPPAPLLIAVPADIVGDVVGRKAWYKLVANAAFKTTAVVIAGSVFHAVSDGNVLTLDSWQDGAAIGALFVTYYVFNVVPLMLTVALAQRRRFLYVLHANIQSIYLDFLGTFLFALLPAFVMEYQWRLLPILAGVGIVVYKVFELANRLRRETQAALGVIVDIVDARDPYTFDHSLLVAEYARRLAERMVGDPNKIEAIVHASHLHDIGKVGVSDTILLKPGGLTADEFETMKQHPEIGRRILEKYSQFRSGADIVYAHQEHWDGTGYPRGLSGEQIPLGARIIAVVDAFVAMTTDRPYRRAMSTAEALAELREGIGTQFDPLVCANFIKLMMESEMLSGDQVVQMATLRDRREQTGVV